MKKRKLKEKLEKLLEDFAETPIAFRSMELSSARQGDSPEQTREKADFASSEIISSFLKTVRTISSVIQPKQPSQESVARVSQAVQERFQEQVSTEKIQRIIGMAVMMEDFRKSLFNDIVATCRSVGFNLTPKEIAALRSLKEDAVKEFANSLDERITKFFPTNLP